MDFLPPNIVLWLLDTMGPSAGFGFVSYIMWTYGPKIALEQLRKSVDNMTVSLKEVTDEHRTLDKRVVRLETLADG